MTGMDVSIALENVSVIYSNGITAIEDISFRLENGTICALLGVNGGGKSTVFKSIMGLVKIAQGDITINGLPIKAALKQNLIAYVPQNEDIDWTFPILVEEVVMQGRYGFMNFLRRPRTEDREAVSVAMQRMGITELARRQIGELSGGQKKRVFLARALAQESPIVLLDEPFTGVDFTTEEAIMDLLKEMRTSGHLILVSTHNLGNVSDYCDQAIFINKTIKALGSVTDTFTQANLEATFGGILKQVGIPGKTLHDDDDQRSVTIISDHEKPAVFYGTDSKNATLINSWRRDKK